MCYYGNVKNRRQRQLAFLFEELKVAKGKYHKWIAPDGLIKLEGLARDGLTDEQIAEKIGVSASTLYDWKKKYSEISEALKKGKEVIDRMVENALLKKALGYETKEVRVERDNEGYEKTVEVTRHVPPDTTAGIFWLKNRKPDVWRSKIELDHSESLGKLDELLKGVDALATK